MIECTTLMSQKDDCYDNPANVKNTLDTGTTSVIQYTKQELSQDDTMLLSEDLKLLSNNQNKPDDAEQNSTNPSIKKREMLEFEKHINKSSSDMALISLDNKVQITENTHSTNLMCFQLADSDNTLVGESNILLNSPMMDVEDRSGDDSSSDDQNEEVISSRTKEKKLFKKMFVGERSVVQQTVMIERTIDPTHTSQTNDITTQITEHAPQMEESTNIDYLIVALTSLYNVQEDPQSRYCIDKLIKFLEDIQGDQYKTIKNGIIAKVDLLMSLDDYISEEPVAKVVESTQPRASIFNDTEKKPLLGTYDNIYHQSSFCNTQSKRFSTNVLTKNVSVMEDDDNDIDLSSSNDLNKLPTVDNPYIDNYFSDHKSQITDRARKVAETFSRIISGRYVVKENKKPIWEYLVARVILLCALKQSPLSLPIVQNLIRNPVALTLAWDIGRDSVSPVQFNNNDKMLEAFQDEIYITKEGTVEIKSSRQFDQIDFNSLYNADLPFIINNSKHGNSSQNKPDSQAEQLDLNNYPPIGESPEMLHRQVNEEIYTKKENNQQRDEEVKVFESAGKSIFNQEKQIGQLQNISSIPQSSTTMCTKLNGPDGETVVDKISGRDNPSMIISSKQRVDSPENSEDGDPARFLDDVDQKIEPSDQKSVKRIQDDEISDDLRLDQDQMNKQRFLELFNPVYKDRKICILSQNNDVEVSVQNPEKFTDLIYIGQQIPSDPQRKTTQEEVGKEYIKNKLDFEFKFSLFTSVLSLQLNNCIMPDISNMSALITMCLQNVKEISPFKLGNIQKLKHLYMQRCSFISAKSNLQERNAITEQPYDLNDILNNMKQLRYISIIECTLPQILFIDTPMIYLQTFILRQNKGLCMVVMDIQTSLLPVLEFLQVDVITKFTRLCKPLNKLLYAKTANIQRPSEVKKIHKMYIEMGQIIQQTKEFNAQCYRGQFQTVTERCDNLLQEIQTNKLKRDDQNFDENTTSVYKLKTLIIELYDMFVVEYRKTFEYILLMVIQELLYVLDMPPKGQEEYCQKNLPLITSEGRSVFFAQLIYKWVTQIQHVSSEWDMYANILIAKVRHFKEQNRDFNQLYTSKSEWIQGFFYGIDDQLVTLHLCKPSTISYVDAIEVATQQVFTTRRYNTDQVRTYGSQQGDSSGSRRPSLSKSDCQSQSCQDSMDDDYISQVEQQNVNIFDDNQIYDVLVHDQDGDISKIQLPKQMRSFLQLGRGYMYRSWWEDPFGFYDEYKNKPIQLGRQSGLVTVALYRCPYPSLTECTHIQNLSISQVKGVDLNDIKTLQKLKRIFINQITYSKQYGSLQMLSKNQKAGSLYQKITGKILKYKQLNILDILKTKKELQFIFLKKCGLPEQIFIDWDISQLKILDVQQDGNPDQCVIEFDMNKCKPDNLIFVNSPYKVFVYGSNPSHNLIHITCKNTLRMDRIKHSSSYGQDQCPNESIYLAKRNSTPLYETLTRINNYFLGKEKAPEKKANVYRVVNEFWHSMQFAYRLEKQFYLYKCALMIELMTDDWLAKQYQNISLSPYEQNHDMHQLHSVMQPFQQTMQQNMQNDELSNQQNQTASSKNDNNEPKMQTFIDAQTQNDYRKCIDFADLVLKPVVSNFALHTHADLGAFHFLRTLGAYFLDLNIDTALIREIYNKPTAIASNFNGELTYSVTDVILAIDSAVCIGNSTKLPRETILLNQVGGSEHARCFDISRGDHKKFIPSPDVTYQLLIVRDNNSLLEFGRRSNLLQMNTEGQEQPKTDILQSIRYDQVPIKLQSLTFIGNKQKRSGLQRLTYPVCRPDSLINLVLYDCACYDLSKFINVRTFIGKNVSIPSNKIGDWLKGMKCLQKLLLQGIKKIQEDVSKDEKTINPQEWKSDGQVESSQVNTLISDQIITAAGELRQLQWLKISSCHTSQKMSLPFGMSNLEYLSITKTRLKTLHISLVECNLSKLAYLEVGDAQIIVDEVPYELQCFNSKSKLSKSKIEQNNDNISVGDSGAENKNEQLQTSVGLSGSISGQQGEIMINNKYPYEYVSELCFLQCGNQQAYDILCPALCNSPQNSMNGSQSVAVDSVQF